MALYYSINQVADAVIPKLAAKYGVDESDIPRPTYDDLFPSIKESGRNKDGSFIVPLTFDISAFLRFKVPFADKPFAVPFHMNCKYNRQRNADQSATAEDDRTILSPVWQDQENQAVWKADEVAPETITDRFKTYVAGLTGLGRAVSVQQDGERVVLATIKGTNQFWKALWPDWPYASNRQAVTVNVIALESVDKTSFTILEDVTHTGMAA